MKKICFLVLYFLFPFLVSAASRYEIEHLFIDAHLQSDGAMEVRELFVLDGSVSTFHKNIYYRNSRLTEKEIYDFSHDAIHNGSSIENLQVYARKVQNDEELSYETMETEFFPLQRIYYEEDKKDKEYVESSMQDGKRLKIFYENMEGRIAFLICYTIKDVVVLHKDIAEVYWTFVDSEMQDGIENLKIQVTLPKKGNPSYNHAFIHGDLTSNINAKEQIFEASMKKIDKETAINMRVIFDNSVVSNIKSSKTTNLTGYQTILNLEKKHTLEEHETEKKRNHIIFVISSICKYYIFFILIWWIYVYFRYDREYKSNYKEKFNKDIITDYSVEVAGTFLKNGATHEAFLASFFYLIYQKNIKISFWRRKENYEFILDNRDGVTHTEDVLLDLLFERVGKKGRFTLDDFQEYLENKETFPIFQKYYLNWVNCVTKDTLRENFYEQNGKPIITSIFLLLISFFILFANLYFGVSLVSPWIVFLLSFLFFFYSSFIKKKSKKGQEDYVRWNAYETYLKNGIKNDDNMDMHFVYSILFHQEDKVKSKLLKKSVFKNEKIITIILNKMRDVLTKLES